MGVFTIGNLNNPPFSNINSNYANVYNSHTNGIPFSNTNVPNGIHTLAPAGTNIQSAAGIYPCAQKGGRKKINTSKIHRISKKYTMKGSKKKYTRRNKRWVRSKYTRNSSKRRINCGWELQHM